MESTEYTGKELARILDLTPTRIHQLAAEGRITRLPSGKYPPTAIQEYILFLRDKQRPQGPVAEEIEREKLRKLRRENDVEEGQVAPVSLLAEALQKAGSIIVANLESLPLLMTRHWPEVTEGQLDLVRQTVGQCKQAAKDMKIEVGP